MPGWMNLLQSPSSSQGKRAVEGPVEGDDSQPKPARRRGRPRKLSKTPEEPYRGGGRPTRPSQSSPDTTEKSPETSTDTELYCLCHRPDDGKLMVQCDQCDCWYHGLCVGVSPEDVTTMDQFECPTCMGGMSINRLFLFYRDNDDYDEEEAPQAHPFPGAAGRRGSRGPGSTCPFLGCLVRTRTMRNHVTVAHLHPVFRRSVPPEAGPASGTACSCGWPTTCWEKEPPSRTWRGTSPRTKCRRHTYRFEPGRGGAVSVCGG